jgi:uncharacterized protein YegP (UPF0339 family)
VVAGVVSLTGAASTVAQEKKATTKTDDTKKTTTKKTEVTGTVELTKDAKGMFRFKVVGEDDKTIMQSSKGYEKKEDALKALETVKAILNTAKVTEVKDDKDKK